MAHGTHTQHIDIPHTPRPQRTSGQRVRVAPKLPKVIDEAPAVARLDRVYRAPARGHCGRRPLEQSQQPSRLGRRHVRALESEVADHGADIDVDGDEDQASRWVLLENASYRSAADVVAAARFLF